MKSVSTTLDSKFNSALWLSDLHLDKASGQQIGHLLANISATSADCFFITGDISNARSLTDHLGVIAAACRPRHIFFTTGNHDYYGGSIARVGADIDSVCAEILNLHHLDGRQIIPLNRNTCLIGHRGWADSRAGYGDRTCLSSPDHRAIHDFRRLTREQALHRMQELGRESAAFIRQILPLALTRYRQVIMLTHTPPFAKAVRYNGAPCGPIHLPHFTNVAAGLAIRGIARAFPKRRITILAGHTHSSSVTHIDANICVRVAQARTGRPSLQEVLQFC